VSFYPQKKAGHYHDMHHILNESERASVLLPLWQCGYFYGNMVTTNGTVEGYDIPPGKRLEEESILISFNCLMNEKPSNIVLIGMPGSGKSTVGVILPR
jgi:hypothetical protein